MILGVLFVLIGLSIILKAIFHIDLPIVRIAIAAFFIYLGVKILVGDRAWSHNEWSLSENNAIFSEEEFKVKDHAKRSQEYNIVFGRGVIDLTQAEANLSKHLSINCVFGNGVVYVDPKRPVFVKGQAVFGDVTLPNANSVSFGTLQYRTPTATSDASDALYIDGSAVFGSLRFVEKTAS